MVNLERRNHRLVLSGHLHQPLLLARSLPPRSEDLVHLHRPSVQRFRPQHQHLGQEERDLDLALEQHLDVSFCFDFLLTLSKYFLQILVLLLPMAMI